MTISEAISAYLEESGESMRSLSIRAGLGEKAVADILRIAGIKPRHRTLDALSRATGLDLSTCDGAVPVTYAGLIAAQKRAENNRTANRLTWLVRQAGWVPETEIVCRRTAVDFLASINAASCGLSKGSFATYKSEAIAAVTDGTTSRRRRDIGDLFGTYGEIHAALKNSDMAPWRIGTIGSFLTYLHDREVALPSITTQTMAAYFVDRLETSPKDETRCRRHVLEVISVVNRIAVHPDLCGFGFPTLSSPFAKTGGKYGVDDAVIAPLLAEFDEQVAPWALGEMSRDGLGRAAFIASLDARDEDLSYRKQLLRRRTAQRAKRPGQSEGRSSVCRDDVLIAAGFLTDKTRWSARTLATRRGYVVSLAKAIVGSVDLVPESMSELLDPDFLETAIEAMRDANTSEHASGYLGSVLKCVRKIATQYQQRSLEELERIDRLIETYDRKHKGIAPRNRARLRKFTDDRIQQMIDLGDTVLRGVNAEIGRRRKAHQKEHGVLPKPVEVIDRKLAQEIMAVVAHDLLLRHAPRSDNVLRARLEWIAEQDGRIRITVPPEEVKMRGPGDDAMAFILGVDASCLMRSYLDGVRTKALLTGDEANPYLFPGQVRKDEPGHHYKGLLRRLVRLVKRHVGVDINPHLYRHLIGWIWLKDDLDHLPKVSRMLGHKSLQTTVDYYAELDARLTFDGWQQYIDGKRSAPPMKAA